MIDCSNVGEYVDCLSLLLASLSKLKTDASHSYVSMHFMKHVHGIGAKEMVHKLLGASLKELEKFLGLKCLELDTEANEQVCISKWTACQVEIERIRAHPAELDAFLARFVKRCQSSERSQQQQQVNMFSASALARLVLHMLDLYERQSFVIDSVKKLLANRDQHMHHGEEFLAALAFNATSPTSTLLFAGNDMNINNVNLYEFTLKMADDVSLLGLKALKLNEIYVRVKVFHQTLYFIWHSFEFEVDESQVTVRLLCRDTFFNEHQQWSVCVEYSWQGDEKPRMFTKPEKVRQGRSDAKAFRAMKKWIQ